jgi:hypothetical protein
MSIIVILALVGLCVICNKLSRFFTRLGKLLEQMSDKAAKDIARDICHKEYIRSVEATHTKALRRAKDKIQDADYENRVREEINALTK